METTRPPGFPGNPPARMPRAPTPARSPPPRPLTGRPSPSGRPGGQKRFSDLAIETTWTLRRVFSLPVRPTEGFLRSVLFLMDVHLEAPDHTPRSRRSQRLEVGGLRLPPKGPLPLVVASTELSRARVNGPLRNTADPASEAGGSSLSASIAPVRSSPKLCPRRRALTRRLASI